MSNTNENAFLKGSEWRRWDLHIHTPQTKKNDGFAGQTPEEKWDNYIQAINDSTEEISVIGITDYFCIENYFKFKELVASGRITKRFDLILPNIELRVVPVTSSATPINIHCIFNPEIEDDIETRFLSKLNFNFGSSDYSANKSELIRLGKNIPGRNPQTDAEAHRIGIEQYVIEMNTLKTVFEKDPTLRANTIIVVSNKGTDGVSGIVKHKDFFAEVGSQLDTTRWSIYQFSNAIFSANPGDCIYFSGEGTDTVANVIEKCGKLMPCFHGCDAHNLEKIFKPDENRYCWIKADPTFEGLKQTLYEPKDRVKIQSLRPDIKNDRHIISEVNFKDAGNLFGQKKIYFNDNLNAIIGGKSSGKSLLLYNIAKSIDPDQVERTSTRLKFEGYNFGTTGYDMEVVWKNGDRDLLNTTSPKNRKIIYIPQLYINHLVERNNKDDLNQLIENILLQQTEFKTFYEQKTIEVQAVSTEIDTLLTELLRLRTMGLEAQVKSKEIGQSEAINKNIAQLTLDINNAQKASQLTPEEFQKYTTLQEQKASNTKEEKEINDKGLILSRIHLEVTNTKNSLFGSHAGDINLKGKIDNILSSVSNVPEDVLALKQKLEDDFNLLYSNMMTEMANINIDRSRSIIAEKQRSNEVELKPFLDKISGQEGLKKLSAELESEQKRLLDATILEKQIKEYFSDFTNVKSKISALLQRRQMIYEAIKNEINQNRNNIGSGISLTCSILTKSDKITLFDQASKNALSADSYYYRLFPNGGLDLNVLTELFNKPLRVNENKLVIDGSQSIQLKARISFEDVLKGLTNNPFIIDYSVTYNDDDLLSMSPGKKGTVLLILFLQISSSEFPILIDQPEDNLDNRTIYDLLCKIIRDKKKDRQIIIVSHNANLVVSTDAENIIVANQEGAESLKTAGVIRFGYVNGSLENSKSRNAAIKNVLLQQGIKEHVCDILEGGDEAFKQRERKYAFRAII